MKNFFLLAIGCITLWLSAQEKNESKEQFHKLTLSPKISNVWAPGFCTGVFFPFKNWKLYYGGGIHYDFYQAITKAKHELDNGGYFEFFFEASYFKEAYSTIDNDIFFTYSFGSVFSFEHFTEEFRNFLIPYMSIRAGGIYINYLGNGFLLIPALGLALFSTKNFNIVIENPYLLNTASFGDYLSIGVMINANFIF